MKLLAVVNGHALRIRWEPGLNWRLPCNPVGEVADTDLDPLVARLVQVIDEVQPDVVVTFGPDGVTGHPDHVATGQLASRAWVDAGLGELWYAAKTEAWLDRWRPLHDEFGVWMTEEPTGVHPDEVELIIDLEGDALEAKRAVLEAHRSQTEGLAAAFGEDRYRRWVCQEVFRRPSPAELSHAHVRVSVVMS